jgi:hypothetical protein
MSVRVERETDLINTFVVRAKRERYVEFVRSRHRMKFLRELHHFHDFEPACVVPVTGGKDAAESLIAQLRRRGAGSECYVISDSDLDGTTGQVEDVIRRVFGVAEGTLVCCVPRSLAYYEGEEHRFILHRQRAERS